MNYTLLINKADPGTPYYFHRSQPRRDDSQRGRFFSKVWYKGYQKLTNHKQTLIKCSQARDDWKFIQVSTYGIFFIGAPHQGESEVCLGNLMPNTGTLF